MLQGSDGYQRKGKAEREQKIDREKNVHVMLSKPPLKNGGRADCRNSSEIQSAAYISLGIPGLPEHD